MKKENEGRGEKIMLEKSVWEMAVLPIGWEWPIQRESKILRDSMEVSQRMQKAMSL